MDKATIAATMATEISDRGVAFRAGIELSSLISPPEFSKFATAWDGLVTDDYLPGGDTYRKRRYGRLTAEPLSSDAYILRPMQHSAFTQARDFIPLYGGKSRAFEPIEVETLISSPLLTLVDFDLSIINQFGQPKATFIVGVHMIRILALSGLRHLPAPEGRHSDGHRYVAMHLMRRYGCEGGETHVFLPGEPEAFLKVTLTESLDTLIVDDRRVEHGVTAVQALEYEGARDMLLVDFDLADRSSS
jgi:hypothetical protein